MVRPEMTFPVQCTACGCPLPSVDAGPCPQCGSTAKTVSAAGSAHGQSSARGVMEAVVVATVTELREAIRDQKHEIIWRLPNLPLVHTIVYGMLVLAMLALVRGYNVEYCPKIVVKGMEMSFCMKLTKPAP